MEKDREGQRKRGRNRQTNIEKDRLLIKRAERWN